MVRRSPSRLFALVGIGLLIGVIAEALLISLVAGGIHLWRWYYLPKCPQPLRVTVLDSGGAKLKVESKIVTGDGCR